MTWKSVSCTPPPQGWVHSAPWQRLEGLPSRPASAHRLLQADKEGQAPSELDGVRPRWRNCHWLPGLPAGADRAMMATFLVPCDRSGSGLGLL